MGCCDLVLFLRAKKANVPTLGLRFLVKFPRLGKAIEVKYPTYAWGPEANERRQLSNLEVTS